MGHTEGISRRGCAGFRSGLTVEGLGKCDGAEVLSEKMRGYSLRLIMASLN